MPSTTHAGFRYSLITLTMLGLTGCLGSDSTELPTPTPPPTGAPAPAPEPEPLPEQPELSTFAPDGEPVAASITWTDYGVPYVKADNLEGLGYGVGYAFANDNICILADQIIKFNAQRSRFFGPHTPGTQDNANLINDFGFKALGIRDNAEQQYDDMSEQTRALLEGYAQGYNEYLSTTGVSNIDPGCAGQPWVQPISAVDLLTYAQGVALLPGASNFVGAMFIAAPPGQSFAPVPAAAGQLPDSMKFDVQVNGIPDPNPTEAGSNGWALGKDLTSNGQGMLLANPHFPHTGNQRFWQFGTEIPGQLKVVGGSLSGMPGIINIGFNEHVAWTHTFSTADHFVLHRLNLNPADASGTSYMIDGEPVDMTSKTIQVEVAVAPGVTTTLQKTSYYSEFGPLIVVPGALPWGTDFTGEKVAFAIKDANLPNFDIFDHWLGLNRARNIEEYKEVFQQRTGIVFNNAMATDKDGNAFYIDGSSVPNLSEEAVSAWSSDVFYQSFSQEAGLPIVPGNSSLYLSQGTMGYERAPKLSRTDFVQNSNNSYWLTNPAEPITDVPLLYGTTNTQQTLRSRMGQKMLAEGGSDNGLFTLADLRDALTNNRNYLGEAILDSLLAACTARGDEGVLVDGQSVSIAPACDALAMWDGRMNLDSAGAMMFREFATEFANDPQWQVPFNPQDPVNTPRDIKVNETVMQQLAVAMLRIQNAGLEVDATLGEVQFVERSLPDGSASGIRLPWAGANNVEGGFNVYRSNMANDGLILPRHTYPLLPGSQLSEEGQGYHITYGSSWKFVMAFTEQGPQAEGILTYSQSRNLFSDHYSDQTQLYSQQPQLRPIHFTTEDIEANAIKTLTLSSQE
ncbi:acylase [Lacimicrobium sp. SS2-24]|uniref:acylase n=1 Tax=Lacimicrobium sp. SS2-24 TaxID=2005569 RepID=UPI000B4C04BD|nr:acylase [Lacimicrobium sp. SS2-24]